MKAKTVIQGLVLIAAVGVFGFSGSRLYSYMSEAKEESAAVNKLSDKAVRIYKDTSTQASSGSSNVSQSTAEDVTLYVDFDALWEENSDIKAWIYSPDTPINYPVLQSDDNDYYLRRLPDKKYNTAGSLFIDFHNSPDFTNYLTIIYGHNMKNNTMFGTLDNYKKQSYYDGHPVIYLSAPENNYTISLIAGFVTSADSQFYVLPTSLEEKNEYIDKALKMSTFKASDDSLDIDDTDRLIMLSTCSYDYSDARYVLIGVIK